MALARTLRTMALGLLGAVLACACGGGGSGGSEPPADAEALAQAAADAVIEPGMVFHVKTDEGEGQIDAEEIWIDGERELFRIEIGEKGDIAFSMSVGEGGTYWSLDGFQNEVEEEKLELPADHPSRIDAPAVVLGLGPLGWLAYGENVEVVGEKESEGRDVVVVETREKILEGDSDYREGSTRVWRVELDRESHLVVAYEMQVIPPEGEGEEEEDEEGVFRVVYEVAEFIPREELPEDFFSPEVLYDAAVTFEERLEEVRAAGIQPYWLGERFESKEGELALSSVWNTFVIEGRGEAALNYSLLTPRYASFGGVGGTVVITLKPAGSTFSPPEWPMIGPKPESEEQVTVQGQEATLYTSKLKPEAGPCAEGFCITPDVPLYHRLVVTLDDTAIQIEALVKARPDLGVDENPFNNREAILALAEALEPAQ